MEASPVGASPPSSASVPVAAVRAAWSRPHSRPQSPRAGGVPCSAAVAAAAAGSYVTGQADAAGGPLVDAAAAAAAKESVGASGSDWSTTPGDMNARMRVCADLERVRQKVQAVADECMQELAKAQATLMGSGDGSGDDDGPPPLSTRDAVTDASAILSRLSAVTGGEPGGGPNSTMQSPSLTPYAATFGTGAWSPAEFSPASSVVLATSPRRQHAVWAGFPPQDFCATSPDRASSPPACNRQGSSTGASFVRPAAVPELVLRSSGGGGALRRSSPSTRQSPASSLPTTARTPRVVEES